MKCHEAKRRLDPFMDGELALPENLGVLEHLNLCAACAAVFEGEKRLRAELKAGLGAERAPAGLEARLRSALRGPAAAPLAFPRRPGALAAAALLVALVGSLLFSEGPGTQLLAAELSARHAAGEAYACHAGGEERRCCCPGCTPDAAPAVRAFFARRAERDYCAHLAEGAKLGYVLEGVAAWRCRGEDVFWSTWRTSSGARVSHALVALDPPLAAPRLERKGGRCLLFYPRGELACVFIFDAPAEAERFVSALGLPRPGF